METSFSLEQRAQMSFEKAFDCDVTETSSEGQTATVKSFCHDRDISMTYDFDSGMVNYAIDCQEKDEKNCLKDFGKYFIFPPTSDWNSIRLVKQEEDTFYYRVGKRIVTMIIKGDQTNFWVGTEGIYR